MPIHYFRVYKYVWERVYKPPLAFYNLPRIVSRRIAGQSRHGKHEHFVPDLRSELVPPRVKTMAAAAWQVWDSVQRTTAWQGTRSTSITTASTAPNGC